jgi:hypothetical protein
MIPLDNLRLVVFKEVLQALQVIKRTRRDL